MGVISDEKMMKAVLSARLATVSQQQKKATTKRKEVSHHHIVYVLFTSIAGISWRHLCKT